MKKKGLGFGFYYSQNQDWTTPGGTRGPATNDNGDTVTFEEYFHNKCLPQVDEITTRYGDIVLIWFDTPGGMPKNYAEELMHLVHKNDHGELAVVGVFLAEGGSNSVIETIWNYMSHVPDITQSVSNKRINAATLLPGSISSSILS